VPTTRTRYLRAVARYAPAERRSGDRLPPLRPREEPPLAPLAPPSEAQQRLTEIRHLYHDLQRLPGGIHLNAHHTTRSAEYNRLEAAIHAASREYRRLTEGTPL
jgi:hypothetical protein